MSYRIEANQIVFDTPPREGAEVEITVSTEQNLRGFSDPNSFYPRRVREVDTNRLAVNEPTNQHPVVIIKQEGVDDLTGEPKSPYNPKYPYNHVRETESGHIVEFDDTPGFERIHEYHRSGTFYEVHPDGSKVTKIVGNDYEIVHHNKSVRVRGNVQVFVDGDTNLYVRGNLYGQVDHNMKWNVGENIEFHAGKNIRMYANSAIEMTSQTTTSINSVGNMLLQTNSNYSLVSGGDYSTSVKGSVAFAADVSGDFKFGGTFGLASTGAMVVDTAATLNIGSGGAMNLDGATVDLNSNGRTAVTIDAVPDLVFLDSGSLSTGINAWNPEEPDVAGNASTIDAPKSAEVLEPKPFVELPDAGSFFGNDDEEFTEEQLRAGVASGQIRPTSHADYSYNALDGSFNVGSAARRVLAQPRIPDVSAEHAGQEDNPYVAAPEATSTTATLEETPDASYDASGNYIGGVNYNLQLSPNFNLGQLSANSVVSKTRIPTGGQHGLTQKQIIDNLKTLAVNALEPIKAQYPSMFVTNAFRPASGSSQHERGQAADMQFTGIAKADYYDIAQWIRANVPHDQLILEFKNTGTGLPWIHISLKAESNRSMIFTMFNHSRYREMGNFYQLA